MKEVIFLYYKGRELLELERRYESVKKTIELRERILKDIHQEIFYFVKQYFKYVNLYYIQNAEKAYQKYE